MVYTIGETVLDIIFQGDQPITAKAGGSMLNSAVSLGRAGIPVTFISELGSDRVGEMILDFLERNNVSVNFIQVYPGIKTPLALAFLDDEGNASYTFYKSLPEERLTGHLPDAGPGDVVLFGSFFSISPGVRNRLSGFISKARQKNALIIYDPNFREQHLNELETVLPWIYENIDLASIVRGSDEDFMNIFGAANAAVAFEKMNPKHNPALQPDVTKTLIFTRNKANVEVISPSCQMNVPVPPVQIVSTIGAGDAFNAGIIFELTRKNIRYDGIQRLTADEWKTIVMTGIRFASDVCGGWENYISSGLLHNFA